jgi:hypothetical protein
MSQKKRMPMKLIAFGALLAAGLAVLPAVETQHKPVAKQDRPKASQVRLSEQGSSPSKGPASKVIGHLETRDRVVTMMAGRTYVIRTKEGRVLAENISSEKLQAMYPEIYELVNSGLAGGGAFLDARVR